MGSADRILRILMAVAIAILYFAHQISGTVTIVLGALPIIFVATSFMSYCPLYLTFGISTRQKQQ